MYDSHPKDGPPPSQDGIYRAPFRGPWAGRTPTRMPPVFLGAHEHSSNCQLLFWRLLRLSLHVIRQFIKSFFKITQLTNFLIPFWRQEQHKNNGTTSGQIGPQVPSGLIFTKFGQKFVMFSVRALYLYQWTNKNKLCFYISAVDLLLLWNVFLIKTWPCHLTWVPS